MGASTAAATQRQWNVEIDTDNTIHFLLYNVSGTNIDVTTNTTITDTNWHYILHTWNGTHASTAIDGGIDKTIATPNLYVASSSANFSIGRLGDYTQNVFSGVVSNLTIYNGTVLNYFEIPPHQEIGEYLSWSNTSTSVLPTNRIGMFGGVFKNKIWMMGGRTTTPYNELNDTYYSTDAQTWTLQTSNSPWPARSFAGWAVMGGRMYVFGGVNSTGSVVSFNDTWSTSDGVIWVQNSTAPWLGTHAQATNTLNGKIYVVGGWKTNSQVWSTSDGDTWAEVNASAPFSIEGANLMSVNNSLILVNGKVSDSSYPPRLWKSYDGNLWTLITTGSWPGRYTSPAIEINNTHFAIIGGGQWSSTTGETYYNDVIFCSDIGVCTQMNTAPNFTPRFRNIAVNYNGNISIFGGKQLNQKYVSTVQTTVNYWGTPPLAMFTPSGPLTIYTPNGQAFADTSTGNPISWIWQFNEYAGNNTWTLFNTSQNATFFGGVGVYGIRLNASTSTEFNISTQSTTVTVVPPGIPVASFTANVTSGRIPLAVQFTDTSINNPTSWSWVFTGNGDVANSILQSPVVVFSNPGVYSVNFTATNANGTTYLLRQDYINVVKYASQSVSCPNSSIIGAFTMLGLALMIVGGIIMLMKFLTSTPFMNKERENTVPQSTYFFGGIAIIICGSILLVLGIVILSPIIGVTGC
jgi:PKD repeat protein